MSKSTVAYPISTLTLDPGLYPREGLSQPHWRRMVEAIKSGFSLPPILVEAGIGRRVVDGWHRVSAHRIHFGEEYEIACEIRAYPSAAAIFQEAMMRNATHGRPLTAADRELCVARGTEFGLAPDEIAASLRISRERFDTFDIVRESLNKNEAVHISRGTAQNKLTGRRLPFLPEKKRHEGFRPLYYVNRVVEMLAGEDESWREDEALVERLHCLQEMLREKLD